MSSRHFHRRYQSVDMEPMDDSSDNSNQTWLPDNLNSMQLKRSEMNELIMDYLVHEGFKEAAERFREEAGIEPNNLRLSDTIADGFLQKPDVSSFDNANSNKNVPTTTSTNSSNSNNNNIIINNSIVIKSEHNNSSIPENVKDNTRLSFGQNNWCSLSKIENPEMLDKRIEIRQLIEDGNILKAQSAINLYYPEFLDIHRMLYFKLQQQHLIELIRHQKISEVLTYVHDQLSVDELADLNEMEKTLALLAYEHPDKSPYAGLLHNSHRLQLASEINDTILQETTGNVEPTKPRLVTLLKLLFWTQSELEKKKIQFPKMTDLVNGTIVEKN